MSGPDPSKGWRKWATKGATKGLALSDWAGGHANNVGAKFGVERFWPTTGDYAAELDKCERILRTFCVEGLPVEEEITADPSNSAAPKKKRKVYRKVPPKIIQEAKGIVIFTSMRSGIAPFGGAGGSGIVIARLKDGSWSAPSFVTPNNLSAGFMLGLDVYNAVLILRTEEAVKGFRTHHVTLGTEIAVAAGPLGYGVSAETGLKHKTPIYSYVLSKGFYAGVEVVGQVFIDRFDENERVYYWPGIKAGDILDGKVRRPPESDKLFRALHDAELGIAQGSALEWNTDEVYTLDLGPGETLKLPPTPEQLSVFESAGIRDEDDIKLEAEEKKVVRALPPPPRHPYARNASVRATDVSVLEGRKGMRSPEPGLSASQCNSPSLEAEGMSQFTSPSRSLVPSPLDSPKVPEYGLGLFREPVKEKISTEPVATPAVINGHIHLEIPAAVPIKVPENAEGIAHIEIPAPPRLEHTESNTSQISLYSSYSDGRVPPAYELAVEEQERK